MFSKEDSDMTGIGCAIELNQSILYTPLILKASIMLSSKRRVAETFMSGTDIDSSSFWYLLTPIKIESQLHL